MSREFAAFCERLLLVNQIWKQEKQVKSLRAAVKSTTEARDARAFKTFCDQLLLWNRIWKLEQEVKALLEDGEKLKRARVTVITQAAKRMVLDVQKERLVEEFVKDLIKEVAVSKQELEELREEHDREVQEIHGDWMKDYRRIARELEVLKLAQEARLAEQDVANIMEDSLFESLRVGKKRIEALEQRIAEYETEKPTEDTRVDASGIYYVASSCDDESTDVESDMLSELSSTSTCVSLGGSVRRPTEESTSGSTSPRSQQKRCICHGTPLRNTSFRGSLTSTVAAPGSVVGDAITMCKPSIIDQADALSVMEVNIAAATRTCNRSGRPPATISFPLRNPSSISRSHGPGSKGASATNKRKAPWRF